MDYSSITDPRNPFATSGLSLEVRSMLRILLHARARGLDVVCTSTTDHKSTTSSGNLSRHRMAGIDGLGLAIDCRLRTIGNDIHRAVFDFFQPIENHCNELIYADAPYNIRKGKRVPPYSVSDHHNHIHVSVIRGVMLYDLYPVPSDEEDELGEADRRAIIGRMEQLFNRLIDPEDDLLQRINEDTGDATNSILRRIDGMEADLAKIKAEMGIPDDD